MLLLVKQRWTVLAVRYSITSGVLPSATHARKVVIFMLLGWISGTISGRFYSSALMVTVEAVELLA